MNISIWVPTTNAMIVLCVRCCYCIWIIHMPYWVSLQTIHSLLFCNSHYISRKLQWIFRSGYRPQMLWLSCVFGVAIAYGLSIFLSVPSSHSFCIVFNIGYFSRKLQWIFRSVYRPQMLWLSCVLCVASVSRLSIFLSVPSGHSFCIVLQHWFFFQKLWMNISICVPTTNAMIVLCARCC